MSLGLVCSLCFTLNTRSPPPALFSHNFLNLAVLPSWPWQTFETGTPSLHYPSALADQEKYYLESKCGVTGERKTW